MKHIVVTRSEPGNKAWMSFIQERGGEPYYFPTIRLVPADITEEVGNTLLNISDFSWIIFTSPSAPRFLKRFVDEIEKEESGETDGDGSTNKIGNFSKNFKKEMPKIAVIGDKTADAVIEAGFEVSFCSSKTDTVRLSKEFIGQFASDEFADKGRKVLLLKTSRASDESKKLVDALRKWGIGMQVLPIYKTELVKGIDRDFSKLLGSGKIACITFASPSSVEGFCGRVEPDALETGKALPAIALTQSTARELKKAGFSDISIASAPSIDALHEAIEDRLKRA